jgi:hypothetical protein
MQVLTRHGFEAEHQRRPTEAQREAERRVEQRAVPEVQAIERAERDDTSPVPLPEVAETADELHRFDPPKRLKINGKL